MNETTAVGVVQMVAVPGETQANLATARRYVAQLALQGTNLIVLPELFVTGYDLGMDLRGAATDDNAHIAELTEWAREFDIVIATALLTRGEGDDVMDMAMVIGADGVVASSSKRFLWGDERREFARRIEPGALAKTRVGTVGVAICYEAGFPEVVRDLALRGADIIAIPAAFGHRRLYAWEILTRSRALENGCFVAAAGLTGLNNGGSFAAHSRIVSPTGDVLAGLAHSEGAVMATLDLTEIDRSRAEIPYLNDLITDRMNAADDPMEGDQAWLTSTS